MIDIPLTEFDDDKDALINPRRLREFGAPMPEHVVMCFFGDVIERICADAPEIYAFGGDSGRVHIYRVEREGQAVAVLYPFVGAPMAARAIEMAIILGGKKFIACGGCGVLDKSLQLGDIFIVESAVRDEGVSYHYLPPAREVEADKVIVQKIEAVLSAKNVPHRNVKTWTTSAIFRETRAKIAKRKAEGCLTVDMEAAAFLAVAQFREVQFGQLLYAGDDVSGSVWDSRDWRSVHNIREALFWLALDTVLAL